MSAEIKPGQWVTVRIKSQPRAEAKRKTIIRVCEKDPVVMKERERLSRSRPVRFDSRGGRPWGDRPARLQIVKFEPGQTYRVFGSIDVLRDLNSVGDCVEVSPA